MTNKTISYEQHYEPDSISTSWHILQTIGTLVDFYLMAYITKQQQNPSQWHTSQNKNPSLAYIPNPNHTQK